MTDKMFKWLAHALKDNSRLVETELARWVDRLHREQVDIRDRMKQAYIDNIDGKIDDDIFGSLIADYKQDERKIVRELERRMDADHGYLDEGIRLIGVAKDARRMFQ